MKIPIKQSSNHSLSSSASEVMSEAFIDPNDHDYGNENNYEQNNIDLTDGINETRSIPAARTSSTTKIEENCKSLYKKAKNVPVTNTQKRGRWIPGNRYMPILLLQWLWHPISVMMSSWKHGNSNHGIHHRHHHHHHHGSHTNANQVRPQMSVGAGASANDLFME